MRCRHATFVPACTRCKLWRYDPAYRVLWGGNADDAEPRPAPPGRRGAARASSAPLPLPCVWEGEPAIWCHATNPDAKTRHCLHPDGPDTTSRADGCRACTLDRFPVRHLVYHVYPIQGNGAWQWNVDELVKRLGLFTGKVVVAVVRDERPREPDPFAPARHYAACDSFAAVKERFGPWSDRIEFVEMANDPALREGVTLVPMLERVLSDWPGEAVLYAHAKGASWPAGHVSHRWTEVLMEACLDYWPLVSRTLSRVPICGPMLKTRPRTPGSWFFDGSWYWFRAADLYRREWRLVDQIWTAVEVYPRRHFTMEEAGCLFFDSEDGAIKPYSKRFWQSVVGPKLNRWRKDNAHLRTA